jgi:hypothetical protein
MNVNIVITDAGFAEVVNAEKTGTDKVEISAVAFGSGQYTASTSQTELNAEIKRLTTVSGGAISDNVIHLTVNDNSADYYDVYEVGVFTKSGTLFAVYSQNTPIIQKSAGSEVLLALDITLANLSATSISVGDTNFQFNEATENALGVIELATPQEVADAVEGCLAITPSNIGYRKATTAISGLVELSTNAEAIAGMDTERAMTPAALQACFLKQHLATGYQKLPSGMIIQWGKALIANGAAGTNVVFPIAFPKACCGVSAVSADSVAVSYYGVTPTTGGAVLKHNGNGGVNTYWVAIGY